MSDFCTFYTSYALECGSSPVLENGWCSHHQGKTEPSRRKPRQQDFSGDSKWRVEQKMYQAKEGR